MEHQRFHYHTLEELKEEIHSCGVSIGLEEDLGILKRPVKIGGSLAPNSLAVLPMEGCDSELDGSPSKLVRRRYHRFAKGGAGLLWWEANAVVEEGRANPHQMMLTEENLCQFKKLVKETKALSVKSTKTDHGAVQILQLTHSGRYSRPYGHQAYPMIVHHDPFLDPCMGLSGDIPLLSDDYLAHLPEAYAKSAILAREAGFDGVDIKACHRYLISELLASHTREGRYGGSFENRTRLLLEIIQAVKKATGNDFLVACRFNIFDAHPYPYGFGCDRDDMWQFDDREPMGLVKALCQAGVDLLSNSAGNPYYIYPQVTRPFDYSSMGIPIPREHPLISIERLFDFTRRTQSEAGGIPVVGNGYSWLRQFLPYAGASNLKNGFCSFVGLGRSSFAYPDAPQDILEHGGMRPEKCCVTCSKCTQIMRDHGQTGCVVRDAETYTSIYQKAREEAARREANRGENR